MTVGSEQKSDNKNEETLSELCASVVNKPSQETENRLNEKQWEN